jgi:hypothetical protein
MYGYTFKCPLCDSTFSASTENLYKTKQKLHYRKNHPEAEMTKDTILKHGQQIRGTASCIYPQCNDVKICNYIQLNK